MSEEIIAVDQSQLPERNIEDITVEVIGLVKQSRQFALIYASEIGKRLCEAKKMLDHGSFADWLKEKVEFSQSTANNFMKLYKEYGLNSQVFGDLPYTKALQLLSLPEEERVEIVEQNDVEKLSIRDLQKLIKERDKLKKELSDSSAIQKNLQKQLEASIERETKAKDALTDLKTKEIKPSQEEIDKIKVKAMDEAIKKCEDEYSEKISDYEKSLLEIKAENSDLYKGLEELREKSKYYDADVSSFKTLFDMLNDITNKLVDKIKDIEASDKDISFNLKKAVSSYGVKLSEVFDE